MGLRNEATKGTNRRNPEVRLTRENLKLAEAALGAVEKRVSAGKSAPTEKLKASVEAATSRIDTRRAERELAVARQQLAATWGSDKVLFDRAVGDFAKISTPPEAEALTPLLAQNPEIARWETEAAQRQATLDLAKAAAVPDVKVGAGYRQSWETGANDGAMLATASVPLPLFDRNQGEISRARFGVQKAHADRNAAQVRLQRNPAYGKEGLRGGREVLQRGQEQLSGHAGRAAHSGRRPVKAC